MNYFIFNFGVCLNYGNKIGFVSKLVINQWYLNIKFIIHILPVALVDNWDKS